jgi:hypothetical protein
MNLVIFHIFNIFIQLNLILIFINDAIRFDQDIILANLHMSILPSPFILSNSVTFKPFFNLIC